MSKRVPAKLHHELVEYASLLRALRVRDTQDVTKHLTKANPFKLQPQDIDAELNSEDDLDEEEPEDDLASSAHHGPSPSVSLSRASSSGPSSAKSAKAKGKQKAVDPGVGKQRRRDHWTRWPVRVDDVLKPEWSLEDEVAVVVAQVMKGRSAPAFPVPISDSADADDDDVVFPARNFEFDEEDPDYPFYVPYIAANVADYLAHILGALASLVPARAASMQNRIEPLGWRTVIDVVVACAPPEFANPKVVENVIKRMEALYGPSILPLEGEKSTSFRAVERMRDKEAARKEMNSKLDDELAKYWQTPPPVLPDVPPPKTTSGKKRRLAIDKHMDADFRGKVKPAPKKKRRIASDTKPKRKSQEAIPDAALETPGAAAHLPPAATRIQGELGPSKRHPPPAATEIQGELPVQAGPSSQPEQSKEASVRRSMRPRRTLEVQVLDERVFME
ncbi:hypothetical protein BJ912DRAFT_1047579 [Pholiota molesta]|nr:hypothetical protein BJ912DRAFT_1047579 [Pholiota molesta]